MRLAWQSVQLGDICTFENGDRGENYPGRSAFVEDGIPIINAGHLSSVGIDISEMNFITRERFQLLRSGKIRRGDVLFCLRGSLGKFALNDCYDEGAIASSLIIIRPKSMLDVRFLCAYLDSSLCADMIRKYENGAAQPNLGGKSLEKFLIPLPPLEEQRRIVAVLDEAFAAIATATANAEKNLANARELFSGELRQLFSGPGASWEWRALGGVADARLGKMLDKRKNKGTPHPYLRNLNVRWFEFDLSDLLEMRFEDGEKERYTAINGDLLIVEGGYPGRCAIWEGNEPIYFQKAIHRVRFSDPRLSKILMYMLFAQNNDGSLRQYFSGAGIQHLTAQSLAKIPVPLPPTHERDAIVAKIEGLFAISEEAQRIYRAKLVQLDALKQSFLHRAFTGELTATMPETIAA